VSNRTVTRPVFLDDETRTALIAFAAQATLLCGVTISPSCLVRYAVNNLIAEEMRVLPDLGDADRDLIKTLMLDQVRRRWQEVRCSDATSS
jgi:hypothetical protein